MAARRRRKRPRRKDAFLGIHVALDPARGSGRIGRGVTRRMVRSIIKTVRPDYIQCDAKGPAGLSWYPTKVGARAPGLHGDPLRLWRDVTAARGVSLYVRLAGLEDREAVRRHRSWARVRADGRRDRRRASVFGPYVDKRLLPQLKELADRYGVDGVCVEGDVAAVEPDFAAAVGRAFRRETGVRRLPTKPAHKHWPALAQFCREAFRRYLRHWVDEVHVHAPALEVAGGDAFAHAMPEPVTANVDFLTAEVPPADAVNEARLIGRCLQRQGKPWDLRLAACRRRPDGTVGSTKSADQLKQEAAVVIALGGGAAVSVPQKRDGAVYGWQMGLMAEVAHFCRQRQPLCHRAEPVPQVALLYSGRGYYARGPDRAPAGAGQLAPVHGLLRTLLGLHYAVEVTMPHHLAGRLDAYPLVVVPEWPALEPDLPETLLAYVEGGGRLLLVGPEAARPFARALGVTFKGEAETREQYLAFDGRLAAMDTVSASVRIRGSGRAVGRLFDENEAEGHGRPAASVIAYGEGRIAATYLNLGERFARAATDVARQFLAALVRDLFPKPLVEIEGDPPIDVVVTRAGEDLVVNLVNTGGPHGVPTVETFDHVPPLGPLTLRVRTARRPERVYCQPGTHHLPFHFREGAAEIELPRLDVHETIVFEQAG